MKQQFIYVIVICIVFVFGCSEPNGKQETKLVAQTVTAQNKAPDFTLQTLDGKSVSLSDFRGSYVLLNMWASWCGPCQDEATELKEINKQLHNPDIDVLGVNMTSQEYSMADVQTFVEKFDVKFPILLDKTGKVMDKYRTIAIPTSFLIDPQGKIVLTIKGMVTVKMIKQTLQR